MINFPEQYVPLYEAVKADAYQSDDRKVIVFVSASEADSVAAVRILQVRQEEGEDDGELLSFFSLVVEGRLCLFLPPESDKEATLEA